MILVVTDQGDDCCGGPTPVALFDDRQRAEALIAEYDDAVRRAEADGVTGICHVGDYRIAEPDEVPVNPSSVRVLLSDFLYLTEYLPAAPGMAQRFRCSRCGATGTADFSGPVICPNCGERLS